ncbi:Acyl-coenzyme A oxidase-like protein [Fukomys damarensis]|uniref:Acyl-coenzyme A oxidase-like protein n=1 Tax=Fukomys damarensis TaxID=885580 RepID=A0A091D8G4_FUKDA|nr:Acyl-coenzyme A oxidase-like protein [Fukomys damarensis]
MKGVCNQVGAEALGKYRFWSLEAGVVAWELLAHYTKHQEEKSLFGLFQNWASSVGDKLTTRKGLVISMFSGLSVHCALLYTVVDRVVSSVLASMELTLQQNRT